MFDLKMYSNRFLRSENCIVKLLSAVNLLKNLVLYNPYSMVSDKLLNIKEGRNTATFICLVGANPKS